MKKSSFSTIWISRGKKIYKGIGDTWRCKVDFENGIILAKTNTIKENLHFKQCNVQTKKNTLYFNGDSR